MTIDQDDNKAVQIKVMDSDNLEWRYEEIVI